MTHPRPASIDGPAPTPPHSAAETARPATTDLAAMRALEVRHRSIAADTAAPDYLRGISRDSADALEALLWAVEAAAGMRFANRESFLDVKCRARYVLGRLR